MTWRSFLPVQIKHCACYSKLFPWFKKGKKKREKSKAFTNLNCNLFVWLSETVLWLRLALTMSSSSSSSNTAKMADFFCTRFLWWLLKIYFSSLCCLQDKQLTLSSPLRQNCENKRLFCSRYFSDWLPVTYLIDNWRLENLKSLSFIFSKLHLN